MAKKFNIDDQVGHLLRRAYQRASGNLSARLRPYDLTPVQFRTLVRLWERGALSQNQLGRLVDMPPANIHSLVGRLKKHQLITTTKDPADRRLILVEITDKGLKLIEELIPLDVEANKESLLPLSPAERKIFLQLLKKMA